MSCVAVLVSRLSETFGRNSKSTHGHVVTLSCRIKRPFFPLCWSDDISCRILQFLFRDFDKCSNRLIELSLDIPFEQFEAGYKTCYMHTHTSYTLDVHAHVPCTCYARTLDARVSPAYTSYAYCMPQAVCIWRAQHSFAV